MPETWIVTSHKRFSCEGIRNVNILASSYLLQQFTENTVHVLPVASCHSGLIVAVSGSPPPRIGTPSHRRTRSRCRLPRTPWNLGRILVRIVLGSDDVIC